MRLSGSLSVPIGIGLILLGIGGRAAIEHWMSHANRGSSRHARISCTGTHPHRAVPAQSACQLLGISGSRYQLAMGRFMGREWDNAGARLLLKDKRRTTGSLRLEVDSHIDAVADVDEGNAFIHPVVLTVEDHGSMNLA
jgi:hypothetical protein